MTPSMQKQSVKPYNARLCGLSGKSVEQQDIQSLHRIRSQLVARRTAQSNQIRGLLLEYGIVVPQGISYIRSYNSRIRMTNRVISSYS